MVVVYNAQCNIAHFIVRSLWQHKELHHWQYKYNAQYYTTAKDLLELFLQQK